MGGCDDGLESRAPSEVVNFLGNTGVVSSGSSTGFRSGELSLWRRQAICSNALLVELLSPGNKEGLLCNM